MVVYNEIDRVKVDGLGTVCLLRRSGDTILYASVPGYKPRPGEHLQRIPRHLEQSLKQGTAKPETVRSYLPKRG